MMHYSMFNSPWQWLIILAIVILLFGPGRLGNLGRDLGKSIKEFKGALNDKDITPDKIDEKPSQNANSQASQSDKTKV